VASGKGEENMKTSKKKLTQENRKKKELGKE